MYKVEMHHICKGWDNGDSCCDLKLEWVECFKTRKAAKDFIESKLKYKNPKQVRRDYHKGDEKSYCYWFTGNKFFSEASGETYDEYYQYTMMKL